MVKKTVPEVWFKENPKVWIHPEGFILKENIKEPL